MPDATEQKCQMAAKIITGCSLLRYHDIGFTEIHLYAELHT
jgi:hypothetical protein